MARTGRPPKPVEAKRRAGNPGKRALPERSNVVAISPAPGTPDPARPLGRDGLQLWDRAWRAARHWLAPDTDCDLLLLTCEQVDERAALRAVVLDGGDRDDRRALRELEKSIVSNLSLLGFTPTDRSRLGIAEVVAMSKLEELQRARQSR